MPESTVLGVINMILLLVLVIMVWVVIDLIVYVIGNKRGTIWLDREGWPIEFIRGRWFQNFIRWRHLVSLGQTKENLRGWYRAGDGLRSREWAAYDWDVDTPARSEQ
jgi:hypothetical protein